MFTTDLVNLYNRNIFKTSLYIYIFQNEKCRLMLVLRYRWTVILNLQIVQTVYSTFKGILQYLGLLLIYFLKLYWTSQQNVKLMRHRLHKLVTYSFNFTHKYEKSMNLSSVIIEIQNIHLLLKITWIRGVMIENIKDSNLTFNSL